MIPADPVEALQTVIDMAKAYRRLTHLLDGARRIDENYEQTLDRLLRERVAVVKLLQRHGRSQLDHADFDFEYKENFFVMIDKYLRPALDDWMSE